MLKAIGTPKIAPIGIYTTSGANENTKISIFLSAFFDFFAINK